MVMRERGSRGRRVQNVWAVRLRELCCPSVISNLQGVEARCMRDEGEERKEQKKKKKIIDFVLKTKRLEGPAL